MFKALTQLPIRQRLMISFAALIVLLGAVLGFAAERMTRMEQAIHELTGTQDERDRLAEAWRQGIVTNTERWTLVGRSGSMDLLQDLRPAMEATTAAISTAQKRMAELDASASGLARQQALAEVRERWLKQRRQIEVAVVGGAEEQAREIASGEFQHITKDYLAAASALVDDQVAHSQALTAAATEQVRQTLLATGLGAGVAVALGLSLAIWIANSVVRPLQRTIAAAERIAAGDLTQDLESQGRDETAVLLRSVQNMQIALRELVGQVRERTGGVDVAANEIAVGSMDLSSRTETAASHLQQTAASIAEVSDKVSRTADSVREARRMATQAQQSASAAGEGTERAQARMTELSTQASRITDITSTIDALAFQTNILALNAAVEAARAGEAGRGFAVVASEVRSLAQRSASAAKEIKTLIGTSVQGIAAGTEQVQQVSAQMRVVLGAVDRVNQAMSEIAQDAESQALGLTQVNAAVSGLDQMTQQNAALVEQSAAATDSLREQASQLAGAVATFRLA